MSDIGRSIRRRLYYSRFRWVVEWWLDRQLRKAGYR